MTVRQAKGTAHGRRVAGLTTIFNMDTYMHMLQPFCNPARAAGPAPRRAAHLLFHVHVGFLYMYCVSFSSRGAREPFVAKLIVVAR